MSFSLLSAVVRRRVQIKKDAGRRSSLARAEER
jgi:hypothetical protein